MTNPLTRYQSLVQTGELQPDSYQQAAVKSLQRLYDDVSTPPPKKSVLSFLRQSTPQPKGIYMYGGVGRGKSMLMDLFVESAAPKMKTRRVHFHEFMIEVHDYLHDLRGGGLDDLLPRFAAELAGETKILCFDEFHVTDVADAMLLSRLFSALFDHGVVIVSTSNWAPDDLYENGLNRALFLPFIDLLKEKMEIIHLDSDTDYRHRDIADTQKKGHYFYPLNEATAQNMADLFSQYTDHKHAQTNTFEVKGREIEIESAGDIARASFAQLCERPHGAEDFLTLAQHYKTLFLLDVRKMGYDRRNEAKRFMTLIDVLYDEGCTLIMSAETEIENLYFGHDYEEEFKRTMSRLTEMCAKI